MTSAFVDTKNLFVNFLSYVKPYSYEEWSALPHECKAAALFVQFYSPITLAWYKVKSFYTSEEDGVSCMVQYLMKNVPIIDADPNRFNAKYIYRVAYNCLYCVCHDIKRDKDRYENEMSDQVESDDGTSSLFDTVVVFPDFDDEITKKEFWRVVNNMGPKEQKYLNYLMNEESLKKVSKRSCSYEDDPLRDVEVKLDEIDSIVSEIREQLKSFKDLMNN